MGKVCRVGTAFQAQEQHMLKSQGRGVRECLLTSRSFSVARTQVRGLLMAEAGGRDRGRYKPVFGLLIFQVETTWPVCPGMDHV